MKKFNTKKVLFSFLGLATFASLVGTVSGTLAWYSYSTRANLSYSGTSVSNTIQLQIGIASPTPITKDYDPHSNEDQMFVEFWDVMSEVKWDNDSNYYYFAPIGSGLSSPVINAYLKSNQYATNQLVASTSGSYKRGGSFSLKDAPNYVSDSGFVDALNEYYSVIPFVFRVIRSDTSVSNSYVEGSELWLTDAQVRASSVDDGDVFRAIRMFVDRGNDYENDFILNPSATSKGETVVGGLLDLGKDGYYDYDDHDNEIIYGEYETIGGISDSGYNGPDVIDDINRTGKDECDTFTAKHRKGINYYSSYDDCSFKTAEYECLDSIAPEKDQITGVLKNKDANHPTSLCKTAGSEGHYLGRVDITVYLEGWDHYVVDEELNHYFDLGLTFEINKLGA